MSEKAKAHSLSYCNNILTVNGVVQVVEISEKEAQLKLSDTTLFIKGSGLNVTKLDREQNVVQMETQSLQSLTYRHAAVGFKGLFR